MGRLGAKTRTSKAPWLSAQDIENINHLLQDTEVGTDVVEAGPGEMMVNGLQVCSVKEITSKIEAILLDPQVMVAKDIM
jgi:hypothetical protein